jgi:hypothetical protein
MKKFFSILMIGFMVFAVMPATYSYADDVVYKENVIDKISDWAQTAGKEPAERDRILAANKVERQRKHTEKKAAQMKKKTEKKGKKAGKDTKKASKDMKKKMGL